jgi:hypothetical protein
MDITWRVTDPGQRQPTDDSNGDPTQTTTGFDPWIEGKGLMLTDAEITTALAAGNLSGLPEGLRDLARHIETNGWDAVASAAVTRLAAIDSALT